MLVAVVVIAVAASLGGSYFVPTAHAKGDPAFTLRNFDYSRGAYPTEPDESGAQDFVNVNHWRVTVCTPRPARLRIRASVVIDSPGEYRFVRREPAGCKRHRLSAESDQYPEDFTESRLRVAWRNHRQRTGWLAADDPVPE